MFIGFVDESKASGYILVATLVLPQDLQRVRRAMNGAKKSGQSRIHFSKESDRRRKELLSLIRQLNLEHRVFKSPIKNAAQARAECLTQLVNSLGSLRIHRLVLERDESSESSDRRLIGSQLRAAQSSSVEYFHESPSSEPALWIPDAVAWAIQRGGHWRQKIDVL